MIAVGGRKCLPVPSPFLKTRKIHDRVMGINFENGVYYYSVGEFKK